MEREWPVPATQPVGNYSPLRGDQHAWGLRCAVLAGDERSSGQSPAVLVPMRVCADRWPGAGERCLGRKSPGLRQGPTPFFMTPLDTG